VLVLKEILPSFLPEDGEGFLAQTNLVPKTQVLTMMNSDSHSSNWDFGVSRGLKKGQRSILSFVTVRVTNRNGVRPKQEQKASGPDEWEKRARNNEGNRKKVSSRRRVEKQFLIKTATKRNWKGKNLSPV